MWLICFYKHTDGFAIRWGRTLTFSKPCENKLRREYVNLPLTHKQLKCILQSNSSLKPLWRSSCHRAALYVQRKIGEKRSGFTGEQAAPQLDSISAAKVNCCKKSHCKYCPNVVGSMTLFKESITSSQSVTLKIVLQVAEHTLGQQNAIFLLFDGGYLCLILLQDHRYHDLVS